MNLFIEIISWIILFITVAGVILNTKKNKYSWVVYFIADVSWTIINLHYGLYAQATMHLIFTGLCINGWRKWKNDEQ